MARLGIGAVYIGAVYIGAVRITEFWSLMEAHFGQAYAHSVARDYRLPALGATVDEALSRGESPKRIWRAVCGEFDVPQALH